MTGDAGDVDTMYAGEMHRGQRLAVDLRIGNQHALGYHGLFLLLLFQIDVDHGTKESDNRLMVSLCTDNQHLVADVE